MAVALTLAPVTDSGFLGTQTVNVTSAAFSPGAGTLIIVKVNALESFFSAWSVPTITDSLGGHLTWTLAATQADAVTTVGGAWVFWAPCPSAQTNMTVTVSLGVGAGQYVAIATLGIEVVSGSDQVNPIINITKGTHTGSPLAISITPTYTGSALSFLENKTVGAGSATTDTASAGNLILGARTNGGGSAMATGIFGSAGPTYTSTTAGGTQVMGVTSPDTTPAFQYIGFEIAVPSGTSFPRTAADTLSLSDSVARSTMTFTRTAADTLAPTDSATRGAVTLSRTASDTLNLSDSVFSFVRPVASAKRGSWWALDSVLKTQAELVSYYRTQEPVACPKCGQPLLPGPPQQA